MQCDIKIYSWRLRLFHQLLGAMPPERSPEMISRNCLWLKRASLYIFILWPWDSAHSKTRCFAWMQANYEGPFQPQSSPQDWLTGTSAVIALLFKSSRWAILCLSFSNKLPACKPSSQSLLLGKPTNFI